ncbi:metalloendoproteinase 2-MMP-like [Olea europaea var. sylvestris]|nr:metalloendoproteinase 2-MMP-like [Olea europaea var. sylvestris]
MCIFLLFLTPHALCHTLTMKDPVVTTAPFEFFNNFRSSRKGDSCEGLHQVKKYLYQFGYLNTLDAKNKDLFDDTLESAIKTYQLNHNLDITGFLDSRTVSKMMMPRCGVSDIINGTNTMYRGTNPLNASQFTLFPSRRKWPETLLTYRFLSGFPQSFMEPIRYAFEIWSNKTSFFFFKLRDDLDEEYSDLQIAFVNGEHGDGYPFDGPGGVLSHAFQPTDGRMHFDASEDWIVGSLPRTIDIVSVALHEIGHLLGLGHTNIPDAIMYPNIRYAMVKRTLHQDDIDGIRTLYGS